MQPPGDMKSYVRQLSPEELRFAWESLIPATASTGNRISTIEAALNGPNGEMLRSAAGTWIVEHAVPAKHLVPGVHSRWIPVVRVAMLYVVSHLSAARLAPKLLEQLDLPSGTHPETRLLRLISKVPGLQKLGQVLARNRHLRPSLRRALSVLENGIRDVEPEDVCQLIRSRLGKRISEFDVRIKTAILSEASVSAVVRFTWKNPESGQREHGVFKVLKPYIPEFFAEDMDLLAGLANHFSLKLQEYGLSGDVLSDTFSKVRLLLQHEVDFLGEQNTLRTACGQYRSMSGVRVPRVIEKLCTANITAMTEEHGVKITAAVAGKSQWHRGRLAEKMVEALVVLPLFSAQEDVVFHADPHAGNLLYDAVTGDLTILDWALTERLTREQRRHLGLLFGYVALRDGVAAAREIEALRQRGNGDGFHGTETTFEYVRKYVDELPFARLPNAVDPMRLLERLAMEGVKFPSSLIMLSKVLLTLDGILYDLGAPGTGIGLPISRHVIRKLVSDRGGLQSPVKTRDWVSVNISALLYPARLGIRCEETLADALLPRRTAADTRCK